MKKMLAMFAVMMLLPATALAESECESDADCPEGSHCVKAPSMTCACPPCDPDDGECPECDCPEPTDPEGFCEEIDLGFDNIVAGECADDADCPLDFLCQDVEFPCYDTPSCACACEPCPEGDPDCDGNCDDCDCPEPEPCDEEAKKMCVFTPAECVVDDDCGEGFECYAIEECSGGGSVGGCACTSCVCADCPEGEECPPCECDEEPVCECDDDPPEEFEEECYTLASICFPKEIPCEADADCAEDFVCVDIDVGDSGGGSDCLCPGCACEPCPDGEACEACECPPCECDEEDEDVDEEDGGEMICIPEGWDEAEYMGGGSGGYEAMDTAKNQGAHDDDTLDPEAPEGEEGDPEVKAAGDGEEAASDDEGSSGCTASSTANGSTAALMFFLLLGLALVRTRRTNLS